MNEENQVAVFGPLSGVMQLDGFKLSAAVAQHDSANEPRDAMCIAPSPSIRQMHPFQNAAGLSSSIPQL